MYRIAIDRNRPDFRVFIDLLYGADRNVDTEGDSNPVSSRTWRYLHIADRESDDPHVEIAALTDESNIFEVRSESQKLEELAALYLFMCCGAAISTFSSALQPEHIGALKAKYTVELKRAEAAIWHRSSNENPYPNVA